MNLGCVCVCGIKRNKNILSNNQNPTRGFIKWGHRALRLFENIVLYWIKIILHMIVCVKC